MEYNSKIRLKVEMTYEWFITLTSKSFFNLLSQRASRSLCIDKCIFKIKGPLTVDSLLSVLLKTVFAIRFKNEPFRFTGMNNQLFSVQIRF